MEQISLEGLEELVKQVFEEYPYPRQVGNGLWEIAPGVFGGEKLLKRFHEEIRRQINETD